MKKLFTLLAFLSVSQFAFADAGLWRRSLDINLNGGGAVNYKGGSGSGTTFSGTSIGNITNAGSLVISAPYLFSYKNNSSDVTGATFEYQVYLTSAGSGTYSAPVSMGFAANCSGSAPWRVAVFAACGGGDQEWGNSGTSVNIKALLPVNSPMGNYTVKIRYKITTNSVNVASTVTAEESFNFDATTTLSTDLTAIRALKNGLNSVISWQTASEKDNATFQIERSANATDFSPIGEVKGAGNNNAVRDYTFTDVAPLSGVNYYRLKAVDYNGSATLSKVVSVNFTGKGGDKTAVYPNPVSDVLRVDFTAADASTTTMQVTDLLGRVLLSQNVSVVKGANLLPFNVSSLPSGAYLVKVNGDVTRFVKM
jgi:hypothetical protein